MELSGFSPAAGQKKTAGLIEKETLKKRISNAVRYSMLTVRL
jgi:hypothetical protein